MKRDEASGYRQEWQEEIKQGVANFRSRGSREGDVYSVEFTPYDAQPERYVNVRASLRRDGVLATSKVWRYSIKTFTDFPVDYAASLICDQALTAYDRLLNVGNVVEKLQQALKEERQVTGCLYTSENFSGWVRYINRENVGIGTRDYNISDIWIVQLYKDK